MTASGKHPPLPPLKSSTRGVFNRLYQTPTTSRSIAMNATRNLYHAKTTVNTMKPYGSVVKFSTNTSAAASARGRIVVPKAAKPWEQLNNTTTGKRNVQELAKCFNNRYINDRAPGYKTRVTFESTRKADRPNKTHFPPATTEHEPKPSQSVQKYCPSSKMSTAAAAPLQSSQFVTPRAPYTPSTGIRRKLNFDDPTRSTINTGKRWRY